jgi:hypothetical protein
MRPVRFKDVPAGKEERIEGYLYLEADQRLQNARRNIHGNRDKGTRQSVKTNESRRSLRKAAWMRWPNCANMLRRRRRYSTLVWKKLKGRMNPPPMADIGE